MSLDPFSTPELSGVFLEVLALARCCTVDDAKNTHIDGANANLVMASMTPPYLRYVLAAGVMLTLLAEELGPRDAVFDQWIVSFIDKVADD